jgi:hypothetical protein
MVEMANYELAEGQVGAQVPEQSFLSCCVVESEFASAHPEKRQPQLTSEAGR